MQEVAPPAVIEVQHVEAETIHLGLAFHDETLTLPLQRGQILRRQRMLDDEGALLSESATVRVHAHMISYTS